MGGKHPGVIVRGNGLQISFTYQGKRHREYVRCGRKPTKTDLKLAWETKCAITRDIGLGRFKYQDYFPNSRSAAAYLPAGESISIEQALNRWIKNNQRNWAYSTTLDYLSIVNTHLIPTFGHLPLSELTKHQIDAWLTSLTISHKRINNILTPLRMAYKDAFVCGEIPSNIMARVSNLKARPREPLPFTQTEIDKILNVLTGQCKNIIDFGFHSGLRTSELIALDWDDVDFKNSRIFISKALVRGRIKEPKTRAGIRAVDLCRRGIKILEKQISYTRGNGPVFLDPTSQTMWRSDQPLRKRVWIPALKEAGVQYREQYQMRHTYASMMLVEGQDPMWVAKQLGHTDWGMIRMVYGRWIPNSRI